MSDGWIIKVFLLLSLAIHFLALSIPAFDLSVSEKVDDISLQIEVEKIHFLPKIEIVGDEKKLKETIVREEEPEAESETTMEYDEVEEEIVEVINPQDDAMLRYQDMVKRKIEEVREYPIWARRQKVEGEVYLRFIVLKCGSASGIKIVNSSGSEVLDRDAVDTIKRAEPFPAIPEKINVSQIQMELTIVYALQGGR